MFDDFEKEINALLKGGDKNSKKVSTSPQKQQEKRVTTSSDGNPLETPVENLDLAGLQWGGESKKDRQKTKTSVEKMEEKKEYRPQEALKKADFERIQSQANERLLRIHELQREVSSLRGILREHDTHTDTAQVLLEQARKVYQEESEQHTQELASLKAELVSCQEQLSLYKDKALQFEKIQKEKGALEVENQNLLPVPDSDVFYSLATIFEERGFMLEEYTRVVQWLFQSKILPVSHVHIKNEHLLRTIVREQCHIQCAEIPLPQKNGHLYITVPKERCSISAGFDILECARSIKDELLINGYTSVVLFGGQGEYENLFQILFAHHALRITLAPHLSSIQKSVYLQLRNEHQLAFSFGVVDMDGVSSFSATSVGSFLDQMATYLRNEL